MTILQIELDTADLALIHSIWPAVSSSKTQICDMRMHMQHATCGM